MITDILKRLVYIEKLFLGISKKYRGAVYYRNYCNSSVLRAYLTYVLPTLTESVAQFSYFMTDFCPEIGVKSRSVGKSLFKQASTV